MTRPVLLDLFSGAGGAAIGYMRAGWDVIGVDVRRQPNYPGWDPRDMTVTGKGRRAGTGQRWAEVMGWPDDVPVTQHGLREAIPPAYTEWIGERLLAVVRERAA